MSVRAGPIIAGSILLVVGLAAVVAGGMMREFADSCTRLSCGEDAFFAGVMGEGIFLGGALAGLAGIGLIVAGIITERPARSVPVAAAAPPMRPCPNCEAQTLASAKYCSACGSAVAPVLTRTSG